MKTIDELREQLNKNYTGENRTAAIDIIDGVLEVAKSVGEQNVALQKQVADQNQKIDRLRTFIRAQNRLAELPTRVSGKDAEGKDIVVSITEQDFADLSTKD